MAKKSQTREDRLAAALRENLKRRKSAARTRPAKADAPATDEPPPRPNADMKAG